MRIEKGHAAGGELNGQTTAQDLGFSRLMAMGKDFIGRALSQREALVDAGSPGARRLQAARPERQALGRRAFRRARTRR